jgi:carbon monoxide dehydrogenase subunit G
MLSEPAGGSDMALKLENTFVVAAPVEPTWRSLLDLPSVARCLPGATIEPGEDEATYSGTMRVKLGPVTMDYRGVARIASTDEAARTTVLSVEGRETRGQGSVTATITNRLAPEDGGTRVIVETELSVTGRPAQFGRGLMQDVAASMLGDFARCLSERLAGQEADGASAPAAPAPAAVPAQARPEPLSLTGVVGGVLGRRLARVTRLAAVGRLLRRLAARRGTRP